MTWGAGAAAWPHSDGGTWGGPLVAEPHGLDAEFFSILRRVDNALLSAPRLVRVRGEQWARRLALMAGRQRTEALRRDRDLHAELLLQCVEEGRWVEPFNRQPPDGPLPRLPPHVACAMRRRRGERLDVASREAAGVATAAARAARMGHLGSREPSPTSLSGAGDKHSLASMAAVAVGCGRFAAPFGEVAEAAAAAVARGRATPNGAAGGAAAPPAYAGLVARVAHLQDENRRLRRELSRRPQSVPQAAGEVVSELAAAAPVHVADAAAADGVISKKRSVSPAGKVAVVPRTPMRLSVPKQGLPQPPGPPPPESDTEGFLRFLDAFQDYAKHLCASLPADRCTKAA